MKKLTLVVLAVIAVATLLFDFDRRLSDAQREGQAFNRDLGTNGSTGATPKPALPTSSVPTPTANPTANPTASPTTPIAHELGTCGVTPFESSQRPTLLPIVIPEGDPMYGTEWHYCMKVFGASMWAVEKFSEPLLRHVTSITAEFLDNNGDGVVDDPAVNAALVDNYAAMHLVDAFDKFDKLDFSDKSPMHRFKITIAQYNGETDPQAACVGLAVSSPMM